MYIHKCVVNAQELDSVAYLVRVLYRKRQTQGNRFHSCQRAYFYIFQKGVLVSVFLIHSFIPVLPF